ncbi:Putative C2 domain-containing protein [Septoria linicola]|uniref:C2 domain-containing protein n=1 Tax=Septoria linicola TaxID=215465 RepID=A0A9Q9EQS2_9PEZI|nr:Putative C2 domain-containing protein [Septoria linicola]
MSRPNDVDNSVKHDIPGSHPNGFDEKAALHGDLDSQDVHNDVANTSSQQKPKEQHDEGQNEKKQEKDAGAQRAETENSKPGPSGGYDSIPIPKRPSGYTVKITIHRAENLPMADINGFSSDPYCLAQLNTDTPTRHKEDPNLRWRTSTVRKNTTPEWEECWIVANVPSSGFKLKIRIYDEDPADRDDMLGKVHLSVPHLDESWQGIKNEGYKLLAHNGSIRAYALQAVTTCFREDKRFRGVLYVSCEMIGRTAEDGQDGRLYTIGPCRWIRHYSPILGRLANIKEPDENSNNPQQASQQSGKDKKQVERYNFQANQIQLQGPVPAQLYHRYVEFKPWVSRMFTSSGLSGVLMGKALHHQHARVYNFARSTICGNFPQGPSTEMTKKFLDLIHYDEGGRIFTYVITLDALWRFTETGKEFSIDMLSKHTMHSDVSIYIAFSGEFFVRRLKHPDRPPPPDPAESSSQSHPSRHEDNPEHPPDDFAGGPPDSEPPRDPKHYQLVIDNDSGTYRPNADLLPLLKKFLAKQLPGLHILTLDCNKDAEKQQRMKKEQRERKKREGDHILYTMGSRSSSISSSDIEDLDRIEGDMEDEDAAARQHGPLSQATKDAKLRNKTRMQKLRRDYVPERHHAEENGAVGNDEAIQSASRTGTSTADGAGFERSQN